MENSKEIMHFNASAQRVNWCVWLRVNEQDGKRFQVENVGAIFSRSSFVSWGVVGARWCSGKCV